MLLEKTIAQLSWGGSQYWTVPSINGLSHPPGELTIFLSHSPSRAPRWITSLSPCLPHLLLHPQFQLMTLPHTYLTKIQVTISKLNQHLTTHAQAHGICTHFPFLLAWSDGGSVLGPNKGQLFLGSEPHPMESFLPSEGPHLLSYAFSSNMVSLPVSLNIPINKETFSISGCSYQTGKSWPSILLSLIQSQTWQELSTHSISMFSLSCIYFYLMYFLRKV